MGRYELQKDMLMSQVADLYADDKGAMRVLRGHTAGLENRLSNGNGISNGVREKVLEDLRCALSRSRGMHERRERYNVPHTLGILETDLDESDTPYEAGIVFAAGCGSSAYPAVGMNIEPL
jgi:hypothetical protein